MIHLVSNYKEDFKMSASKNSLGDRMKMYEKLETSNKFTPCLPIYVRIDGRSFSKFTKNMFKPYDERMSRVMQEVTKFLVEETNASIGYTQSDEISLVFYQDNIQSSVFFDYKKQKMVSVIAGLTSAKFMKLAMENFPEYCEYATPCFDCRVFALPNKIEAMNAILWRVKDASKNSISMSARSLFSHKELQGKKQNEMIDMMLTKEVDWNKYPKFFKEGSFFKRVVFLNEMQVLRSRVLEVNVEKSFFDLSYKERVKLIFDKM